MKNFFYQCVNPRCELRFPAHENSGFNERCPKCLGHTELVESAEVRMENFAIGIQPTLNIVVIVDNVRSSFNVGSILRTSECFGISSVYLCGITPKANDKNVQKTSLGAETYLKVSSHNNAISVVEELQKYGYEIWSLELHDRAIAIDDIKLTDKKVALVIGNERCGVDPGILQRSAQIIQIPMFGHKNSLNVEVSFGIALSKLKDITKN